MFDDLKYLFKGVKGLSKAYWNTFVNGEVSEEVKEFRKHQCKTCVLFNEGRCNKELFANKQDDVLTIGEVKIASLPQYFDADGVFSYTEYDGNRYVRGCGCKLFENGTDFKVRFHFTDSELSKDDGSAPCPRNRWSLTEFEKYYEQINEHNESEKISTTGGSDSTGVDEGEHTSDTEPRAGI